MPLKKVAELFDVSYGAIRRLARDQGIKLQQRKRGDRKLTPEELMEAYELLKADVPFRQVAQRYEIHPESLRRLALRDGIELRARGKKLTPTQRKLTPGQLQEAHNLIESGTSVREVAKRLGISRSAVIGLLKEVKTEQ
jgi:transposase